jgi:YegS/Rv2252/BmrU family lipid kinase
MTTAAGGITVILNRSSGLKDEADESPKIAQLFRSHGLDTRVLLVQAGVNAADLARAASRDDRTIVAAGGDGTVSMIASALVDTDAVLGILPLGTFNHFAKDLKIPTDLDGAASIIVAGKTAAIDVGEVNGRIFVNNSSLGLYPEIVFEREQQRRTGRSKWVAYLSAAVSVLRRFPTLRVRLNTGGQELIRRTPFVFVGNNKYEVEGIHLGTRAHLDGGCLYFYLAQPASRFDLLWLLTMTLLGRLRQVKEFEVIDLKEAWIETRRKRLRVAFDGELAKMETPLHYRIRPGALRVIVP